MSLYVSMKIPGKDLGESAIDDAITILASNIANVKRKGHLPKKPALDLTFLLPGKLEKPDFNGMRMGGYTQDDKILYFETAVPQQITQSKIAPYYVAKVLEDMIDNADIYFTDIEVEFDAKHWRSALQKFIYPENVISGNRTLIS